MRNADDGLLPEFPRGAGEAYDIVLVTGDAYVDHPSFGAAMIGRHLQSQGYKVGIIAQPDWKSADEFKRFGKPRLFFGVTAGNVDSMVANYTPDRRKRERDSYTPGNVAGKRPDLASVVYAQRCREAYPDAVIVMGGVEASLRRIAHYDFVQQKVRGSVLGDAKAHLLVYGMGERAVTEIAQRLSEGEEVGKLTDVRGTAYISDSIPEQPEGTEEGEEKVLVLPSAEDSAEERDNFFEMFKAASAAMSRVEVPTIVQPQAGRYVVVNPPAEPLSPTELDALYHLPFTRGYHSRHDEEGGVPALEPVRYSVVTHRGCYGGCSFCALTAHQGKAVVSRPHDGVIREVKKLAARDDFDGTIRDIGGPTANMYATYCKKAGPGKSGCSRKSCLYPEVCKHLETSGADYLKLLREIRRVKGVKHAFVASGIRHDLLIEPPQRRLFRELMTYHVGGQMKVAPEHVASRPLRMMGKPANHVYREFFNHFNTIKREIEKDLHIVPYLIAGHPGTTLDDSIELARFAKRLGHYVEQVQTFTPTPMTDSTCMYHTRRAIDDGTPIYVPTINEATNQRALVQYADARNRTRLVKFLQKVGKLSVLDELYGNARAPANSRFKGRRNRPNPKGRFQK